MGTMGVRYPVWLTRVWDELRVKWKREVGFQMGSLGLGWNMVRVLRI